MRHSALIGSLLAMAFSSVGVGAAQVHMPPTGFFIKDPARSAPPQSGGSRATTMQRHTGAGGRGAHRRWKHLRASGRA